MVVVTEEGQMFGQQRGPEVQFHVGNAFPPQQGGPPGGPQLRGLHHPNHGANPSIPPPHQQQPPPPSQSQHSAGPPGPAPTSTPPGPADMGKQGPPHLQGQPPIPQGGQMQLSFGVPNQQRPNQTQPFFPGGPRGPTPRMPNHRGQVVNMPANNVSQQIFSSHVQVPQLPMYSSHVVSTQINPNQMLFTPAQMPMFQQPRHQNTGTNFYPPANQQQIMMPQHQLFSAFQSSPQSHQFFFPNMRGAGVGGAGGVGGPGLGNSGNQQVVVPGAPPQMGQGAQIPIMPLTGGNVLVSGIPGDSGGSAGPVGGGGGGGGSGKQARRKYALDIVDPNTMKNVDIYEPSGTSTPPRSGDSSARETPQPTTGPGAMDVAADFAARVAKAASEKSSASTPSQLSTFVEPSSSVVSAQVLNVNGPDHMVINNIVTSSEGILNQSDSSISKSQIVVVEESSASSLPWKPQTQLKASNIGNKISSGNKNNKIESSLNKMDEPILITKVESESKSIVKIQPERERSVPPGVPSVSAKDIPIQLATDIHVAAIKEHQPVTPVSESNAIPQDVTPVVSALTNSPIVDVVHQHRAPQREQIPGKSSPVPHTSPRRKRNDVQVTAEKPGMPQNVSLVPTIAVVSSQVPPFMPEVKSREPSLPPVVQELKSQKKSEGSMEDLTTFSSPVLKERRELEKSSRSREKSSQSREIERLPREAREKSQVQEREKSSQNRSKENTAPGVVPVPVAPAVPVPQLDVVTNNPKPSTKPETTSVAPPTHTEDMKHQPNGDTADGPEGKSQRSKSKRGVRMREVNRKGAEKEGTDMDAFSESPSEEAPPVPAPSSPAVSPASTNKVIESQIAKSEESEADKEEEKLVAVRNEENNKVSAAALKEETPVIESTPTKTPALKYTYKEDQWSPVNPDGKKIYERDFLIGLKNDPQSKKKPDTLPDIEVVLKDNRQTRPVETSRPHDAFTPKFLTSGPNSRGPPPKRNSQQGKARGGKPNMIHVNLSLKDEVKLRETENAWRPGRMNKINVSSEQDAKTADLYKKVRGVLNKLTPQKFQTLVEQVQTLPIDNSDRLQGVINLVFEKAVDEPSFSVAYAQMCKVLSDMQVPAERKSKDDAEFVNFRKLLVNRCQHEFEKNNELELNRDEKLKEIENTTDVEKKKELQQVYEEEERRVRMKSVGNIRFIGELFKLQMLTTNIMHRCIKQLISNGDEESLECLCKLLTTIGKDLENKKQDLGSYFMKMRDISNKRGEVSSRVRFMLQDVIELRQGKWVPRRDDSNPKTIDQIQREAEKESMETQLLLSSAPPASRRQDDRNSGNERRKRGVPNVSEDGWSLAGRSKNYPVDTMRLKQRPPEMDNLSLGKRSMFTNWNNSQIKSSDASKKNSTGVSSNFYAALQDMSSEDKKASLCPTSSRPGAGNSTPSPLIEKERMLSPFKNTNEESQSSHGNSVPQSSRSSSRDNSSREDEIRSVVSQPLSVLPGGEDARKNQTGPLPQDTLTEVQIKSKAILVLEEFLSNNNLEEASLSVAETFGPNYINSFIVECLNFVVEKTSIARQKVGVLMSHLINNTVITGQQYLDGFAEILDVADDLTIDVPKIWLYLAEIIAPMLSSETLTFVQFRDACRRLSVLVVEVLPLLVKDKGPNWIFKKWNAANIKWTDFVEPDKVDGFIKQHKLEYTLGATSDSQTQTPSPPLKMEEIQVKLVQFLKPEQGSTYSFDQICDWIGANVGDRISEPQFIRALMTALCESAVSYNHPTFKLNEDILMNHTKFFQKYVDHKDELELQCLYAVQAYDHRLEHPQGLLYAIFHCLWDNNLLSSESFTKWETSTDVSEKVGKGVALKSLTSFFTTLREGDEESEES